MKTKMRTEGSWPEVLSFLQGLKFSDRAFALISIEVAEGPVTLRKDPAKISIDELGFSVRTRNCLDREEIRTVADLVLKSAPQLLVIKNLGKASLREIESALVNLGLCLAEEPPP